MNNLIVEPQCAPGALRASGPRISKFYSAAGISLIKQGRTANRNYSRPYVRHSSVPNSHGITAANAPAEFHFCELFRHFLPSAIVSDRLHCIPENIMNYSAWRPSRSHLLPLLPPDLSPSLPRPRCTGGFIQCATWPINISIWTFAREPCRRGEYRRKRAHSAARMKETRDGFLSPRDAALGLLFGRELS